MLERRREVSAEEDERDFVFARKALVERPFRELQKAESRKLHPVFAHVKDFVVALRGPEFDLQVHLILLFSFSDIRQPTSDN